MPIYNCDKDLDSFPCLYLTENMIGVYLESILYLNLENVVSIF
jgi:hypothetical protein